MAFLDLPTELILLILPPLSESDLAHLLQVHRSLYAIVLPYLYKRHIQGSSKNDDFNVSKNGANGFIRCIVNGNMAAVQHFLTYGAEVNARVSAASIRNTHATKEFVPRHDVQTPLNIAANMGNDTLVSLLLSHGASVTGSLTGYCLQNGAQQTVQPAVVDALLSKHPSTVRLLLQHNSPLTDPTMERGGLVDCAIAMGSLPLLEMLVKEFGADLNFTWLEGVYPLNRAVSSAGSEAVELVRFMLDNGADSGLANGNTPGSEENTTGGGGGQRLLNQAIRHGTFDTLRLLLDRGVVSPTTQPPDNDIFRTWIVEHCTPETVHLLHGHGYFRASDSSTQDDTLIMAVRARRGDIIQLFIDSGDVVDINAPLTKAGSTLLHIAVVRCKPLREAARPQVSCGAITDLLGGGIKLDVDHLRVSSRRCMRERVGKSTPEDIVRCLIRGGADVNVKDARGLSPLDLAEKGPEAVYKMLVDSSR